MNTVFTNQTYLEIILTSGVDITGAKEHVIKYRKPKGQTGTLDATVVSAASGVLKYEFVAGTPIIDQKGIWKFWNYIKFSDDRVARGETVSVTFGNDEE